mgnify:CR=1 FL=1
MSGDRQLGRGRAGQQIGWVIVGGMSLGTLLTLFVVPTVLSYIGASHRAEEPEGTPLATPAE